VSVSVLTEPTLYTQKNKMKNSYIQYTELIRRRQELQNLKAKGVKLFFKKNRFKIGLGVGCLVIAIIPNGTGVFMLPLGLYLLGIRKTDLFIIKEKGLRKIKNKLRSCLK